MSLTWTRTRRAGCILLSAVAITSCSKKETSATGPSETVPNAATILVSGTQQVIRGFGGVNMPGWIADLTADQVARAFGTGKDQLGLSILRIRVPYDSTKFNLEVPTAQLARSLGAIIIASPWTPPAALKTNGNIVAGELADSSYADYAAHLKAFADYMANHGAPLYAVSVQNEPDASVSYESCFWNASQMLKFVSQNAPAIGTRIIAPESLDFDHTISDVLLNDATGAASVSIIGGHLYGGGLASYPLAVSKGKEVWMTEHLDLDPTWAAALATAKEINDCMGVGMNAYIWWYIRRSYGPIDESGTLSNRGYAMSQFARFVRPGSTRINATANPQTHVYLTAYSNGSRLVIVAINNGSPSIEQTFVIQGGAATSFTPYVTSGTKKCVQGTDIPVSAGTFADTLDGESVTTFVSN